MSWVNGFITANLIGIGTNFDNSGIGVAYGTAKIKFPHRINALVNAIGFASAFLGAYVGDATAGYFPQTAARWTASAVLACVGLIYWYSAYVRPRLRKQKRDVSLPHPGWRQGVLLGLGLSITNVANGFGATVASSAPLWSIVIAITAWGYVMIWLGNVLGIGLLSKLVGTYAPLVGGLLLLVVAGHEALG
ncbi:hypothetical protein K7472_31070 [Streptomyces sp. PTM05]|uniref:Integral membrane protein n=1 Tax=Streptantibioticus parmotrematis TaxID=2873249 RepID=A0ABS7R1D1_9ACTN|nr:hypothetical protein [Streptantibioticus parmotrematis]MBY8889252.1 hypothetical protein [Streptantibioticus parmotrematis]